MKRKILFRGRRIDIGKWEYGNYNNINGKAYIFPKDAPDSYDNYQVYSSTVGQYTGLQDMNGKKIFEGDILRFPPKERIEENNYVSYEVFWHDNDCADRHIGWQMNRYHYHGNVCGTISDFTTCLPKYTEKMIIIGNIYDMKGGNND